MAIPAVFTLPRQTPFQLGVTVPGAKAFFLKAGTTTPQTVYTTSALTTAHADPVVADSAGLFPVIYLNDELSYRVQIKTAADVLVYDQDNINDPNARAPFYDTTTAEDSAGITPVDFSHPEGHVLRYGKNTTPGTTDMTSAIQAALNTGYPVLIPDGTYRLTAALTVASNTFIKCERDAIINQGTAGQPCVSGSDVSNVEIDGGGWNGTDTTTALGSGSGGVIFIDNRGASNGNIKVTNTKVTTSGTAGISCLACDGLWIESNEVSNVREYAILAGFSRNFHINQNYVHDSAETGADNTYGIMATGDNDGAEEQKRCSISFNKIVNFASWDGIMSHDATKVSVIGNTIENVRLGIDIGNADSTNVIDDVVVANNIIHLTSTDNWAAASAAHAGIHMVGNALSTIKRAAITGNIIRNPFNITGATIAAGAGSIRVENVEYVTVGNNVIEGIGSVGNGIGILMTGTATQGTITGNTVEGDATNGAIRMSSITSSALSIIGNAVLQDTTSSAAVQISGSTISKLSIGHNPMNSTIPLSVSTSTITYEGEGSFTGTLTGVDATVVGTIEYSIDREAATVTLEIPVITGTSNTTTARITGMPVVIRPSETQVVIGVTTDNGVDSVSRMSIATNGVIQLHFGVSATFTGSGTKGTGACTVQYRLL